MPELRSKTSTSGRNMAGARALWRATGMTDSDFGKPIVAIANSFTQFVPGHVHLRNLGMIVADAVAEAGGVAKEFNTIAVDDGIAMGHGGMLYSLPSRELIADAVEYMVQAHCADALVCISNCDKITPACCSPRSASTSRPCFVSGGPMEGRQDDRDRGRGHGSREGDKLDLIDAMIASANEAVTDEQLGQIERSACPTCGSCSGMFTANSMNCLTEAIGLALPGNGSTLATHAARRRCSSAPVPRSSICASGTTRDDDRRCCRARSPPAGVRERRRARRRHGRLDQHRAAPAGRRPRGRARLLVADIDAISRRVPCCRKVAPNTPKYHMEDVHRAGGIPAILGELDTGPGCSTATVTAVHSASLGEWLGEWDVRAAGRPRAARRALPCRSGGSHDLSRSPPATAGPVGHRRGGAAASATKEHAYTGRRGLAILFGNIAPDGSVVKTAGVCGGEP
jgi:dihydroxy-acid dehydratase